MPCLHLYTILQNELNTPITFFYHDFTDLDAAWQAYLVWSTSEAVPVPVLVLCVSLRVETDRGAEKKRLHS